MDDYSVEGQLEARALTEFRLPLDSMVQEEQRLRPLQNSFRR
jgi:hypothetical protein